MADWLAGVEAKIERGFFHIDEFELESGAFLDTEPYSVSHEIDAESGMRVGVLHVEREPPLMLGVIAAEAMGQFRSCLDHLISAAVRLDHPKERRPPHFPIHLWDDYVKRPKPGRLSPREECARVLRPEQVAILDSHQAKEPGPAWPGGPRPTMLSVIQYVTNVDKHDVVHPVYSVPRRLQFHGHPNVLAYLGKLGPPFVLEEGAELYLVTFVDESDMNVPLDLAVRIAVGPVGRMQLDVDGMRNFGGRIREIVAQFREATPEFRA